MKPVRTFIRCEEIKFFLRLHGLWEGIIHLPRPPPPPFPIDTMEPIETPWQAIKEWIPDDEQSRARKERFLRRKAEGLGFTLTPVEQEVS